MSAPFAALAEPLSSEEARSNNRNSWKVLVPLAFLCGLGCAVLWNRLDQGPEEVSPISMSAFARPGVLSQAMVRPMPSASAWQPTFTKKAEQIMQPVRAEAAAAPKEKAKAKAKFNKEEWESEFKALLDNAADYAPEFGGGTGGLLRKAQTEEKYAITWEGKAGQLFEHPNGGAATMKAGTNLMFLARKEHCLALGTQLRTKFKIKAYRVFRIFPNGEMQFIHPADGVFPEKVNKGRVAVNTQTRSIGENPSPHKTKWTGGPRGPGFADP